MATTSSTSATGTVTSGDVVAALQAVITTVQAEATTAAQQADARTAVAAAQALLLLVAPQGQQTTILTVGPQDTLFTLAARLYGDARLYWALVTLNSLDDPRLEPGQALIVPAR